MATTITILDNNDKQELQKQIDSGVSSLELEAELDEVDSADIHAYYATQSEKIVRDEQIKQIWAAMDASATVLDSGVCGENLTWELYSSGLLKISGTGRAYDYCKGILIGKSREEIQALLDAGTIPADYAFQDGKTYDDANGQYVSPWYKYRSECDWNYTTESAYNAENPNGWKYNRIEIEEGITYIGDWMFYRVCGAVELTIPEGVTTIGRWGIRYSPDLKYVTLPDSLQEIEYRGVSRLEALVGIKVGNQLTKIGYGAFGGNACMPNIVLPDSLTTMDTNIFEGSFELTRARLGKATSLPSRLFVGLTKFEYVNVPEEVTSIGEYAFYKTAVKKIRIPKNVTTIEDNAFYLAEKLAEVYIDSPTIAAAVAGFNSCGYLVNYAFHVYVKDGVDCPYAENNFRYNGIVGGYKVYTNPNYVIEDDEETGDNTGDDTGEDTATVIATGSFGNAVTYTVTETDTADEYALKLSGSGETTVTQNVSVPWYDYKDNIVSVEIENGITTTIGNMFREYAKLRTAKVGVANMPNFMFAKCTALSSVDLTGVESIGQYAFWNTTITELIIPDSVITINDNAFLGVTTVTNCVIGKNVETIGNVAMQLSNACTTLTIPADNALKTIGNNTFAMVAFKNAGALYLPNVETIGDLSFNVAEGFTSVTIGSKIKTIGKHVFIKHNGTVTIQTAQANVTIDSTSLTQANVVYTG